MYHDGGRDAAGSSGRSSFGARYGRSLLVAFGWYVTLVVATAVGMLSVPSAPQDDCSAMFACMSPVAGLVLVGIVYGAPVLTVLLVMTALLAGVSARSIRSAVLAGSLSAVAGIALTGGVVIAYVGAT
ncbi:MAG TPA: hypothetical protein VFR67_08765 [Pilimelia sp.]|nr:hypothetical protein [Pilimelia sp.]